MLVTSSFVFRQIGIGGSGGIGAPPLAPMLWLLVALVPLSALFSALALAVAAMARSSKEGQYYLMPLMMVTLPLVLLPMLPGTTLSAGTSLIPVTGMFLLVRALVEAQYTYALLHLPMVFGVTAGCLWLAVTWARRQFEDESVLFGGRDQWELSMWVRHLWRDRQTAATPAQAFACGAIILVALFFGKLAATEMPTQLAGLSKMILMPQIGMILAPALLMATMLTTSLRKSLRIRMPYWTALPLAVLLGITLHPSYVMLAEWISYTYPISDQATEAMKPFTEQICIGALADGHLSDGVRPRGLRGAGVSRLHLWWLGSRERPFAGRRDHCPPVRNLARCASAVHCSNLDGPLARLGRFAYRKRVAWHADSFHEQRFVRIDGADRTKQLGRCFAVSHQFGSRSCLSADVDCHQHRDRNYLHALLRHTPPTH